MLLIVLVPSAALLIIGAGGAGYLVYQGHTAQSWATTTGESSVVDVGTAFTVQVGEERRLSLLRLGDSSVAGQLANQRNQVNGTLLQLRSIGQNLVKSNPGALKAADTVLVKLLGQLQQIRQGVDAGRAAPQDVYGFYNQLIDILTLSLQGIAKTAPDPGTAVEATTATELFNVAEAMSRSNALAAGGVAGGGLNDQNFQEFARQQGYYHNELAALVPNLTTSEQASYARLTASTAWHDVTNMENFLLVRGAQAIGSGGATLPMTVSEWQNAATQVHSQLLDLYAAHHRYAAGFAADAGHRTYVNSLLGGGAILLIALVAAFVAIRLSNRLVNRLKRLRRQTLELADTRLPEIVTRLRTGEQIDVEQEVPPLQYGKDEIGQVAEAFNKAQRTAVAAAAHEAEIQKGVRAVFLNIAHRSQVVVHRQLDVLDKAEREQENPEHLETLFHLDHLATRARRNAENLLVLGGDRAGRQWRHPVPLVEIVRSAVGETEQYQRVTTGRLPNVRIAGTLVADLIHLVAELVDNATAFSPPDSRVEVFGNTVGKGLVIEVEDQGLGLTPELLKRINEFLRNPPDFGVMALSADARLGLFVISQLAVRHGITVTLVESVYGGVRAIVLVPSGYISADIDDSETTMVKQLDPAVVDRRRRLAASAGPAGEPGSVATKRAKVGNGVTNGMTPVPQTQPQTQPEPPAARDPRPRAATATTPPSNGDGTGRHGRHPADGRRAEARPADGRPALPRRRRQASLAPQLADESGSYGEHSMPVDDVDAERSAEQARNRMMAFQRGTRDGRGAHGSGGQ